MALRLVVVAFAASFMAIVRAADATDVLQLQLLSRVQAGTKCGKTQHGGRICDYSIGKLAFSIKDVGAADAVIGFHHSDIDDDFYAVIYFGCVVVVPGKAHPRNYDLDYGVYVSPVTGNVYKTSDACRAASAQASE